MYTVWESIWFEPSSISYYVLRYLPLEVKSLSLVRLFATPWTVAYQAPPSMGFSRQEYWSGLSFPSPDFTLLLTLLIIIVPVLLSFFGSFRRSKEMVAQYENILQIVKMKEIYKESTVMGFELYYFHGSWLYKFTKRDVSALPCPPQIPLYFSKITMYAPIWVYEAYFPLIKSLSWMSLSAKHPMCKWK